MEKPSKKEWYKTWWGIIIAIVFLFFFAIWWIWAKTKWSNLIKIGATIAVIILFFLLANLDKSNTPTSTLQKNSANTIQGSNTKAETPKVETITEPAKTEEPKPAQKPIEQPKIEEPKPTETPAPAQVEQVENQNIQPTPSETVSQKNAVKKAKSYLGISGFSHDGLVAQLEYNQFSHADAVYGADNSDADWNEQAAKKAKQYMEISAFSRGSLIAQLKYNKFTQAQAEYGANTVGL